MNESKKILTSVLHTAQMGQSGIQSVMHYASKPGLQHLLQEQLLEYQGIETQAKHLATEQGWELPQRSMLVDKMSCICARCRLIAGDKDSAIAGMLIQGNSRGMILGIKNLNKAKAVDASVGNLANKLLNLENLNIQKTQEFL